MKKLFLALMAVAAIVLIGCEKKSMNAYDWEGAYTLETTSEVVYADGAREFFVEKNDVATVFSSEMTIYKEGKNIFAQTLYFGTPDTSMQGVYWGYAHQPKMLRDSIVSDSATEFVIVEPSRYHPYLINGFIYMEHGSRFYTAPFPAQVKSSTPNTLAFHPSQPFDAIFVPEEYFISEYTDTTITFYDVHCQYIYDAIKKSGDEMSWDITLHVNYPAELKPQKDVIVSYIFHNKVIKK